MKTKFFLLGLLVSVALLAGCSKDDKNEPKTDPKFDAEYGHAEITVNLQGTYKYFVSVNVIADGKVLGVISKDNPTIVVEFPINGESSLKTEAVFDKDYEEELEGTCNHKMNMSWKMSVMLNDSLIAEKEYSDYVDYQSTVSATETSLNAVYKLAHTDIDREFIFTKDAITGPVKK